jgi:hypothetical protein
VCECDDFFHYWSSERCRYWHNGRELQQDWFCFPHRVDHYCNWLGSCDSTGSTCLCQDPLNRSSIDRCASWRPLPSQTSLPSSNSSCLPGDRGYCNNNGACAETGDRCRCDDEFHFWSTDFCSHPHDGPELADRQCCKPGETDYYCSWLGQCNSDGRTCRCFDSSHRLPSERCQYYHDTLDSNVSVSIDNCPTLFSIPPDAIYSETSHSQPSTPSSTSLTSSLSVIGFLFLICVLSFKAWDIFDRERIVGKASTCPATEMNQIEGACTMSGRRFLKHSTASQFGDLFSHSRAALCRNVWFFTPWSFPSTSHTRVCRFLIASTQVLLIAFFAMLLCVTPFSSFNDSWRACGDYSESSSNCLSHNSLIGSYCQWDPHSAQRCFTSTPHVPISLITAYGLLVVAISFVPMMLLSHLLTDSCALDPSRTFSEAVESPFSEFASAAEEAAFLSAHPLIFPPVGIIDQIARARIGCRIIVNRLKRHPRPVTCLERSFSSLQLIREFICEQLPPVASFIYRRTYCSSDDAPPGEVFVGVWFLAWTLVVGVWGFCLWFVVNWVHEAPTSWLNLWLLVLAIALVCWTIVQLIFILVWNVFLVRSFVHPPLLSLRTTLITAHQRIRSTRPSLCSSLGGGTLTDPTPLSSTLKLSPTVHLCQHTSSACRAANSPIFSGLCGVEFLRLLTDRDLVSGVMQLRELSEGVESKKTDEPMVEWHDAILLGATDESEMVPLPPEDVVILIRERPGGEPPLRRLSSDAMSDVRLSSEVFDV